MSWLLVLNTQKPTPETAHHIDLHRSRPRERQESRKNPDEVLSVTRQILEGGAAHTAVDVYSAMEALALLRRQVERVFAQVDLIAVPSVPTRATLAQVAADPLGTNARLGRFTNFVNLLDLTALAVPAGRVCGVPVGITLVGPALTERTLLAVARAFKATAATSPARVAPDRRGQLAVVGAHLRGQPLHHKLVGAGARLVARTWTAPSYRLYRLNDTEITKPGLVPDKNGHAIEVEVYQLDPIDLEGLARRTRAPLSIGTITLKDGLQVAGYVCDPAAAEGLTDISAYGGWRQYLAATECRSPRTGSRSDQPTHIETGQRQRRA